jgi:hypothetical protein
MILPVNEDAVFRQVDLPSGDDEFFEYCRLGELVKLTDVNYAKFISSGKAMHSRFKVGLFALGLVPTMASNFAAPSMASGASGLRLKLVESLKNVSVFKGYGLCRCNKYMRERDAHLLPTILSFEFTPQD